MVGTIVGDYKVMTGRTTQERDLLAEKKLDAGQGIDTIVRAFVKAPTFGTDAVFEPVSAALRREIGAKQKAYLAPIRQFLGQAHNALEHELVEFDYAFADVVDAYTREELSLQYGILDESLFHLGQMVDTGDQKAPSVRIPLFFDLPYNDLSGRCTHEITDTRDRYETKKFTFTAKAPFVPRAAKIAADSFLCQYHTLMGKLLRESIVGPTLSQRLLSGQQTFAPTLRVHWIPSDYELQTETRVVDNDPLLTARLGKTMYLLHQWQVDTERPFQQYLDEFMVSKPKK